MNNENTYQNVYFTSAATIRHILEVYLTWETEILK
jgi:hypothetical protein